jgi:hypothetical protein
MAIRVLTLAKTILRFLKFALLLFQSSSPGESHPQALTDPHVNLSVHVAPVSHPLDTLRHQADAERIPAPPGNPVGQISLRADSSPSLHLHYRDFITTTG